MTIRNNMVNMTAILEDDPVDLQPVDLSSLRVGSSLPFPLFKEDDTGYKTIVEEGKIFSGKIKEELQKSGTETLYISAYFKEFYKQYIDHYIKEIVSDKKVSIKDKCTVTYKFASSIMEELFTDPRCKLSVSRVRIAVTSIIDTLYFGDKALKSYMEVGSLKYTASTHSTDVCIYALGLGKQLNIPRREMFKLGFTALLHDIGKTEIHEDILLKEAELSKEEFDKAKQHAKYGYRILQSHNETNKEILDGILYHHEKFDGSGYPEGLKGNSIPLIAQIITIADIFSAVSTDRSYKNAVSTFETLKIMKDEMSQALSPKLLPEFIKLMSKTSLL